MTLLLLQMSIVLLVAVVCGRLARMVGQARVVGEIAGGILIGPSVFGRLAPHLSANLFPPSSLAQLELLSTVGLVLFLFLIGMELDSANLAHQRATALAASGMSILLPFGMAALLAHPLRTRFAPHGIGNIPFVLFLGIAMSITAFPVLARILEERNLQGTALGTTAILCAAVDDVVGTTAILCAAVQDVIAWSLLAVALAMIGEAGGPSSLPLRLLGLAVYLFVMLGIIRPLAARLVRRRHNPELSLELLGLVLAGVLVSAAATDKIGIHPLFGAFLAGVCFPRVEHWQIAIRERLDMLISVLLLPLFFALTGMRTRLDLLNGASMWIWAGIVILAQRPRARRAAQHPRTGRVDRAEYRLQRGSLHPDPLHHDGGDGAGDDHVHRPGAESVGDSGSCHEARSGGSCARLNVGQGCTR